jgi:CheY-like chemotaxis protein
MNGILGFAALLKDPILTGKEQKEYISIIEKSGARMLNIINDIMSISKVEAGQMDVNISETNVNEQIEYIFTFFSPEAKEKGLRLFYRTQLPSNEAVLNTDKEKLYAILTNLVKNAFKFTSKGSIVFGYEKKGKYLEFFVKDTGIGISNEQKEYIFERFRQGSESLSRHYDGAGLGLSICKAYVEMLDGEIRVESEPGKGSVFYFTLPYNAESEVKTATENVGARVSKEYMVKNLKILIVEDDEISEKFLSAVVRIFSREVIIVKNGREAVETCRNHPEIDLILMDIKMSEMDGYEAVRKIREFNNEVIIIVQTAYAFVSDKIMALEAGCNDYIRKPIDKDLLNALINKHFKKKANA